MKFTKHSETVYISEDNKVVAATLLNPFSCGSIHINLVPAGCSKEYWDGVFNEIEDISVVTTRTMTSVGEEVIPPHPKFRLMCSVRSIHKKISPNKVINHFYAILGEEV